MLSWTARIKDHAAFRYLRLEKAPARTSRIELFKSGNAVAPDRWHATNLFAPYDKAPAKKAWEATVKIPENPAPGSYLCVAIEGDHGKNGAFAGLRCDDGWIGSSQRAPSFPAVVFEFGPRITNKDNTYFFPITKGMLGEEVDAVVLGQEICDNKVEPKIWITTYPNPWSSVDLILE